MNQQVRKILRSSFCSKDKWVEDKNVNNCFKCDKKFNPLFRRKHHCRVCGNIFCNLCSQFQLNGTDLGEDEKDLRVCEGCYKRCWKYIMENDPLYYISKRGNQSNKGSLVVPDESTQASMPIGPPNLMKRFSKSEDEKLKQIKALISDFLTEQHQPMTKLVKASDNKLSMLVQMVLKNNRIPFSYYDFLYDLARRIIRDVQPNAMITHNMDICKHIKVKLEKSDEPPGCNYIIGTTLKKGISSKKMSSSYANCNVLLVYGNIEAKDVVGKGDTTVAFEEMIENRKKSMTKVLNKLKELQVDMIFLEGSIDKEAQDLFFNGGVTVITKVKVECITRLKISLDIQKVVDNIGQLDEYVKATVVGRSRLIYFTQVCGFDGDKDMLVVEGQKVQNGLTLIISGPDQAILRTIKEELKTILRVGRHIYLKNYKVLLDQQLIQSMKPQLRNTLIANEAPNIFFSQRVEKEASTVHTYLRNKHLDYKRIVYVESDFSSASFPEITRTMIDEYNKARLRGFRRKWPFFTEICGNNYRDESRRYYSEDDWPIGQYILKKVVNLNKKCEVCRRPCYLHTEVYYGRNLYVRIEAETRIIEDEPTDETEEADIEFVFETLAKTKNKSKLQCYIECQECHQQLTNRFVVTQQHLELSLLSFLANILAATNYSRRESREEPPMHSCQHFKKCRVFQFGNSFLRIYVDFLVLFRSYKVPVADRENYIHSKDTKAVFEACLLHNSNVQKIVCFLHDEIKKVTEAAKNPNFEIMIKNPKQSFLKARNSFVGGKDALLTQNQCVELFVPELLEQISRINQVSQLLLNAKRAKNSMEVQRCAYNCIYLLRKMLRIIWEVRKAIQKHELGQKFQHRQEEDDSIMLEDMDINAMIDDSQSDIKSVSGASEHNGCKDDRMSEYNRTEADFEQENWISMHANFVNQSEQPVNRKLRKTESNLLTRKQLKPTEEAIQAIFKSVMSGFRAQSAYVDYVSCNPFESQSLIASALNSMHHKEALDGTVVDSLRIKMVCNDLELLSDQEEIKKINNFLDTQEKMLKLPKDKRPNHPNIEVNILYPKLFEKLRQSCEIDISLYIPTIAGAEPWVTMGGKSGSLFMRSHNDLVVVKRIHERQFLALKKLMPQYFTHIQEGSLLTPILGAYEVIKGNRLECFIVMENLFFGMNHWHIYDFKGSKNRRFSKPPVVPLDLNYLLDRNSQPIFTSKNLLKHLPRTLNFLVEHNIIDYSLILVLNVKEPGQQLLDGSQIRIGVIDYLRQFGLGEKVEKVIKGAGCTVIEPGSYRERMLASVSRYFSPIPN